MQNFESGETSNGVARVLVDLSEAAVEKEGIPSTEILKDLAYVRKTARETPVPLEPTLTYVQLDTIVRNSEKLVTELWKTSLGLRKIVMEEVSILETVENYDVSKYLTNYFCENLTEAKHLEVKTKVREFETFINGIKHESANSRLKNISYVLNNYDLVIGLRMVILLRKLEIPLSNDLCSFIFKSMDRGSSIVASVKLGAMGVSSEKKPNPLRPPVQKPTGPRNRNRKSSGGSKRAKPSNVVEKKNKFSKRYSFYSKNNFMLFNFNINNLNKLNNISLVEIPENILKLLSIGGSFVLLKPNRINSLNTMECIKDNIVRYLTIKGKDLSYLNTTYKKYIQDINERYDNLPAIFDPLKPLDKFLTDNNLIVKNADKNMGLTIMPRDWYNCEVLKHLEDINFYEKVPVIYYVGIWQELRNIVCNRYDSPFYNLEFKEYNVPKFYIIPKLHKKPVKTRPIVPNYNWVTTQVSIYLHKRLWKYVQDCKWIVENSLEVVKELDELVFTRPPLIYSIDVESMYTNIDIQEGVNKMRVLLAQKGVPRESNASLNKLLNWVLTNNYFEYNGQLYKQVKGTAMGSNVAPAFANLFLMFYEEKMFKVINKPLLYKRYLDDILILVYSESEFFTMFEYMQKMSPSLKFTYVRGEKSINFLDLNIHIDKLRQSQGLLAYSLFQKPESKHLYLHPDSELKDSIKFGWITGENIRLLRNNSSKRDFNNSMREFILELKNTGYTNEIINSYVKYRFKHRHLVYQNVEKRNLDDTIFIVSEADKLSDLQYEFVRDMRRFYDVKFNLVQRNFHKLIDELNRASAKVIEGPL